MYKNGELDRKENNMKTSFTPGPWHVATRRNEFHSERVFAAGSRYIACIGGSDDTVGEQKANAHLIAAAPELLEALERVVAEIIPATENSPMARVIDQASSAIAKARGEK